MCAWSAPTFTTLAEGDPVPVPIAPVREFDFSDFQAANPLAVLPGDQIDAEHDRTNSSVADVIARLALIQRDDGQLINGSVARDQMDPAFLAEIQSEIGDAILAGTEEDAQRAEAAAGVAEGLAAMLPDATTGVHQQVPAVNAALTAFELRDALLQSVANPALWEGRAKRLSNLALPTASDDAATKGYVDGEITDRALIHTLADPAVWEARGERLANLALPTAPGDATTKGYVDGEITDRAMIEVAGDATAWEARGRRVSNMIDPVADSDATTKGYVDASIVASGAVPGSVPGDENKVLTIIEPGNPGDFDWRAFLADWISDATAFMRGLLRDVGDAASARLALDVPSTADTALKADKATAITAGAGLSGGGDLSADRQLDLDIAGLVDEPAADDADSIAIYDASAAALRRQSRSIFAGSATATGATVARTHADRFADVVNIFDYGAVGDDVTDDAAALAAALAAAAGKTLYLPAGVYRVTLASAAGLEVPAGTRVVGDGRATVLHVVPTPEATNAWTFLRFTGAGASLENVKIEAAPTPVVSGIFVILSADNLALRYCEFAGGHTAENIAMVHLFGFGNPGTQRNIVIEGCEIHNWRFGLLKANADTSTQEGIKILDNYFHDNFANDLAFNTPNGLIFDVLVQGNTFRDNHGGPTYGTFGIMCGCASVKQYRILGNAFSGVGREAVHIEEAAFEVVVSGNSFRNNGKGVYLIDNDVGGVAVSPRDVVITGNNFTDGGFVKANIGIEMGNDSGADPAHHVVIADNTFRLYATALSLVENELLQIFDNQFDNCTTAVSSTKPSPNVRENHVTLCDVAFSSTMGGVWGKQTFENVTTYAAVTDGAASFLGWRTIRDTALVASQTAQVVIAPIGQRMYGHLKAHWHQDATRYRIVHREVTWDGAALTDTNKMSFGTGGVTFTSVNASGGNLRIALNNTEAAAFNGGKLQVEFDGIHIL